MPKLIMDHPARDFTESLLIGNGRLGACVYGEKLREQLVLNESSVWSGCRQEADRPGAVDTLPEIRRLLREGQNYEAQQLFSKHFTCTGKGTHYAHGSDVPFGCYQTLGRLVISWFQAVSSGRPDTEGITDYRRELDLDNAMATVSLRNWGYHYRREYIVSREHEAVYVHLTCSESGQIDCAVGLDRDERFEVHPLDGMPGLCMSGQLADGMDGDSGVRFACMLTVRTRGGRVRQESQRVVISGADEAWLIVTARTDLSGFMHLKGGDAVIHALQDLKKASSAPWQDILAAHDAWYGPQYRSMTLSLASPDTPERTTKELLDEAIAGRISPELIEMYVQYARYQMICCSQPDSLPANLQGLWSDEILTPWNGDWHLNAQQMIYWLVEKAGLSDCHIPYLKLTEALVAPGRKTAGTYYGARGWLVHTCTNPWGFTSPCEDASWGSTTGSPAWQCHHLWEHYLYTLDRDYLTWAYPIMQEAMLFYMDNMVENERGQLITSPSSSPENWFLDDEGRECALCEGPGYDRALVLALAEACLQAGRILGDTSSFITELQDTCPRLAPLEIASDGRLMEWGREYPEPYPFHRHLSHLWGVYPGNLFTREETPEVSTAAEKSLVARGMTTAGWAVSYRGCLYARLRMGQQAMRCFHAAMKYATAWNLMNLAYHCDETLSDPPQIDLANCRYPFQIDGNQGTAAMILLMLLDDRIVFSSDSTVTVHLYPLACPVPEMPCGKVHGIRAKGGVSVNMAWQDGRVTHLAYTAPEGVKVVVHGFDM
ncbi:MAG: glycoside hydrolase family 95 protein [Clostridia bacterium]|nr:glycoside hydrolase family 95 protein [Clostridia bacterium]